MNDRYDLNILVLTYDPIDGSVVTRAVTAVQGKIPSNGISD
jgi:hypothetical protein